MVALLLSFAVAVMLAEAAVHPLINRRPSDTAVLARSIALATGSTAQKVNIQSSDCIELNAWWLTPRQSHGRGVMVCHGFADSAYGSLCYAPLFLTHGYSVLVPESRGHGESPGSASYGVLESGDIVQWLSWMKSNGINAPLDLVNHSVRLF